MTNGVGATPVRYPPYIDLALRDALACVHARERDQPTFVHLGHWDAPPAGELSPDELPIAQLRLTEKVLAMADIRDGMAVLDVACGLGGTLAVLNARHRGMTLLGIDADLRQLAVARRIVARQENHVTWSCGDACSLPYPAKSFARVLCIEAMFHFSSRRAFMAEASRVLCPGGRLVFSDIVARDTVAQASLQSAPPHRLPRFAIEARIESGMGPWPDLWGADADHDALAAAVGLTPLQTVDATAATLPSHACILNGPDAPHTRPVVRRASFTLAWIHRHGYLRVVYKSYRA